MKFLEVLEVQSRHGLVDKLSPKLQHHVSCFKKNKNIKIRKMVVDVVMMMCLVCVEASVLGAGAGL